MPRSVEPPEWQVRAYSGARTSPIYDTGPQGPTQSQIDQFTKWNTNVAGKDQLAAGSVPVAGSAVNGSVKTNNLSVTPATSVNVKDTNLLVSQNFTAASTVVAVGQWSWWGEDGHLAKGCARVDCNGSQHDLVSNEVSVVAGENLTVTVWVKWAGLSYTGSNPIALGVEKYRQGRDPDTNGIVYMDVGGDDVTSLSSPAASSGWVKLTGEYTVPDKVDQLRFRFHVATAVTAGYILWDEAEFRKTDLIPDEAVPGVGNINDNVVNNLYGQSGTGFGHADAAKAFSNTSSAVTSVSSKVAALEAAGSGGSIAGDDFTYAGALLTSGYWSGSYSSPGLGYYQADGQVARWATSPAVGVNESKFYWTGTGSTSAGDYQLVQIVLASALYRHPITGAQSSISIYGRVASDWQSYVKLTLNGDTTWTLKNCVAGVETTMTSGTVSLPGVGSTISLYVGSWSTSESRRFTADINGTPLLNYLEPGTTSVVGAANRRWGWGGVARGWVAGYYAYINGRVYIYTNGWVGSPDVDQWLATDQ